MSNRKYERTLKLLIETIDHLETLMYDLSHSEHAAPMASIHGLVNLMIQDIEKIPINDLNGVVSEMEKRGNVEDLNEKLKRVIGIMFFIKENLKSYASMAINIKTDSSKIISEHHKVIDNKLKIIKRKQKVIEKIKNDSANKI